MKLGVVFRAALRESRGSRGRLVFFTACLAIGVAAIVGVASLGTAIENGLRAQSRELLGADLSVSSRRPLPVELDALFAGRAGVERADVRELATMASDPAGGQSRLVEVKAVRGRFPFYGAIEIEPSGDFGAALTDESAIVAPELLETLGVRTGDSIAIGSARFRVAATIVLEPGRLDFALTAGPRVFLTLGGLARAELEGAGARIQNRALFRLPEQSARDALREEKRRLERDLPGAAYIDVQTHTEAQPTIRRAVERVERYLGLAALMSLVLGGTGVAMIVRAWLAARTPSIALLRCLGYRPREVFALYAGNVVLFALVGSFVGGLAGSLLPLLAPHLFADVLPAGLELEWEAWPLVRGLALGVAIALVFSVPPLTAVWRVAPARVLRSEAEPLPPDRRVQCAAFASLALGLYGAAWVQADDALDALFFTGGMAVLAALLALGAFALRRVAACLPRERLNPYVLHGLAALARPGSGVTGALVALGLGVLVVTTMALVESRLGERLRTALPKDAPSLFLLDVQPAQWPGVRAALEGAGASSIRHVPVVTTRLARIDGESVDEIAKRPRGSADGRRRSWRLTREQRITWMQELPPDNRVTAGELWSDPSPRELSIEEEYAEGLDVGVGSRLTFDVQGVEIEFLVTSLRRVEWESFGINFFLVAEPGALDDAPRFDLAAARLDAGAENSFRDALTREFPNVTVIQVRSILDKVLAVMARLALGVRLLGSFTILTGLVILCGVASASAVHRTREAALLKTLGVTRAGVGLLFATEFALIGLVAGFLGSGAALVLTFAFLDRVIELEAALPWWVVLPAAGASALLAAVCGVLACARALATRPIVSLRSG